MFEQVYCCPAMMVEQRKAEHVVKALMELYLEHSELLPTEAQVERFGVRQAAIDYVSGLTDDSAVKLFRNYYEPII